MRRGGTYSRKFRLGGARLGYGGKILTTRDAESKWFDQWYNRNSVNDGVLLIPGVGSTPTISINTIPQGSGENEVVGNKYTLTSLQLEGQIFNLGTAGSGGTATNSTGYQYPVGYRLCLIMDRQCNGSQASPTDVFEPNAISTAGNINSPMRRDQGGRFKMLKQWKGYLPNQPVAIGSGPTYFKAGGGIKVKYFKKFNPPLQVFQDAPGGAVNNLRDYNFFLIMFTTIDETDTHFSEMTAKFAGYTRVSYYDF